MPLTFPSHAAAILPLRRVPGLRRLPTVALVIGSAAPDLVYLVGTLGGAAHRPLGLLLYCLPAGLAAYLYLEALVLPVVAPSLQAIAPASWRAAVRWIVGPRPLPRGLRGWIAVALALVLGAATHQLWDGFTHAWLWPARVLYPEMTLAIAGRPVALARVLQHTSSVVGLGIVLVFLWRRAPTSTEDAPSPEVRRAAARRLARLLVAPAIAGCVAAGVRLRLPDPLVTRALWDAAWSAAAWSLALLGGIAALARIRRRRAIE
ncbi:MAG: DUF4184 family protein [Nannocystaceae bacterium]